MPTRLAKEVSQLTVPGYQQSTPTSRPDSGNPAETDAAVTEVQIPASAVDIPTVRAVAAMLAGRLDFDLDAVSDLRMAVDEACAELIAVAAPGSKLSCSFAVTAEMIEVTAKVSTSVVVRLSTNTFGWRVLSTLTDRVEPWYQDQTPDSQLPIAGIWLRVNRDRANSG